MSVAQMVFKYLIISTIIGLAVLLVSITMVKNLISFKLMKMISIFSHALCHNLQNFQIKHGFLNVHSLSC